MKFHKIGRSDQSLPACECASQVCVQYESGGLRLETRHPHVSAESVSLVYANSRDGLFDQEQEGQTSIVQRVKDGNVQPLRR